MLVSQIKTKITFSVTHPEIKDSIFLTSKSKKLTNWSITAAVDNNQVKIPDAINPKVSSQIINLSLKHWAKYIFFQCDNNKQKSHTNLYSEK